jgi:hypothetical protein
LSPIIGKIPKAPAAMKSGKLSPISKTTSASKLSNARFSTPSLTLAAGIAVLTLTSVCMIMYLLYYRWQLYDKLKCLARMKWRFRKLLFRSEFMRNIERRDRILFERNNP